MSWDGDGDFEDRENKDGGEVSDEGVRGGSPAVAGSGRQARAVWFML